MKYRSRVVSDDQGAPPSPDSGQPGRLAAVSPELGALFGRALALHQGGRLAEAEGIYRQLLEAQPAYFDALHLLGVIHYQRGEHEEAIRQIDAALRINPHAAAAHNNLGTVLNDLGRFKDALATYDRAIALDAEYADAYYNRANVLKKLNRFDEALADYDRAIALHSARRPQA